MARDQDGKPRETRGRRGLSQRIRDLNEQIKTVGGLGGDLPKWVEALGTIGLIAWVVYAMRPRVDVYGDRAINSTDTFMYKGRGFTKLIIAHPGRTGPFVFGEILLLLNLPSGDWFEIAEDTLVLALLKILFDDAMFPETDIGAETIAKKKAVGLPWELGKFLPKPLLPPGSIITLGARPEGVEPVELEMDVNKALVGRWLTALAYAGFLLLLLKRAVVPRS